MTRKSRSTSPGAPTPKPVPSIASLVPPSRRFTFPPTPRAPVPPHSWPAAGGHQAATDLTVVYDDGCGLTVGWRLVCDGSGQVSGNHPTPDAACQALETNGTRALPPVPPHARCTMVYGGPQTARITGTWQGRAVNSSLSRTNGCQIGRWDALIGLLPGPNT